MHTLNLECLVYYDMNTYEYIINKIRIIMLMKLKYNEMQNGQMK